MLTIDLMCIKISAVGNLSHISSASEPKLIIGRPQRFFGRTDQIIRIYEIQKISRTSPHCEFVVYVAKCSRQRSIRLGVVCMILAYTLLGFVPPIDQGGNVPNS